MSSSHPEAQLQLSKEEIKKVCDYYELGDCIKKPYLFSSKTNINMLIETSKGKYVVRSIRDPITETRVNYVQDILLFLQKNHVPVINAKKNKEGRFLSIVNDKVTQVTPFIEATTYKYDLKQLCSNAKMLRTFHDVLKGYQQGPLPSYSIHPTNERLISELTKLNDKKENHRSKSISKIEKLYWEIVSHSTKFEKYSLPKTIIHDDWHPKNLLYNKDGTVAYVLDYDGFQRAERIYDVAYALYQLQSKKNKPYIQPFLDAYGKLGSEEKEILPFIVAKVAYWFVLQYRDYPKHLESQVDKHEPFINSLLKSGINTLL